MKDRESVTSKTGQSESNGSESARKVPSKRELDQQNAEQSRNYVIERVGHHREELLIEDVAKRFGRKFEAVRNDFYKGVYDRLRAPIGVRGKKFVYDPTRLTTEGRREYEDVSEKTKIGRLGMALIVGPAKLDPKKTLEEQVFQKRVPKMRMSQSLRDKLESHFRKAHRLLVLDSGTTTLAIAEQLVRFETPNSDRNLNSLRILTNGRHIAEALDVHPSKHGILLLGGALRRDTEAVVGLLAERCLSSWLVNTSDAAFADLGIIGTTSFNGDFDMFSDSEDESEIKSRLLNSARIRCVCAASGKVMRQKGGSFAFCRFSPRMVDMVLTDDGILTKQTDKNLERGRLAFLNAAIEHEIYVAVG